MIRRSTAGAIAIAIAITGAVTGPSRASAESSTPTRPHGSQLVGRPVRPALPPIVLPAHPRVYFFGDSWTKGATADPGHGFPQVVGATLGWTVELGPDNSGSGYVHTWDSSHPLFLEKAAALPPIDADLIVLEGGLNDAPGPLTDLWDRVAATVMTMQAKSHGAAVVLIGPAFPDGTVPEGIAAIDRTEASVARALGVHYVSPTRDRWFTPANAGLLVDPATFHPSTAGHAYYAARLAVDLQRIVRTKPSPRRTTAR